MPPCEGDFNHHISRVQRLRAGELNSAINKSKNQAARHVPPIGEVYSVANNGRSVARASGVLAVPVFD